ncbi:MAG: class I SAM-dependent RNA methyltransferase [Candidatus Krumholzibacteriota bacterium]
MNDKHPDKSAESEVLEVTIEKLVTGGDGLARHEGEAIFVPLTAPGDRVRVAVKERRRGFARATVAEILDPGTGRQDPPCPYYGQCGGCDLMHLDPEHQRRAKAAIVTDCFGRLGKMDVSELLTGPEAGVELGYRNRIRVFSNPVNHYGLMRRGTHEVVPFENCAVMPEQFNRDILPWLRMLPPAEQIVVRMDGHGGWLVSVFGPSQRLKVMRKVLAALPEGEPPAPGCKGLLFNNLPLWGRDYLIHEIAGHKYRVGAQSFFQGNHAMTEEALSVIRTWITELKDDGKLGVMLGDLFCGVGLFTLALADLFEKVVAIDSDQSGCRDAENNVKRSEAAKDKARVYSGRLAKILAQPDLAPPALWDASFCLVDPPRTGLGKDGVKTLLDIKPRHLLYMSCDPATLARDAAAFTAEGYQAKRLQVLDMFPQTSHIETLLLLEKTGD